MNRTEKSLAVHLAAALAAAVALAILQAVAGGVVARGLDVGDAELWADLGVRRFTVYKIALFLVVFPLVVQAFRGEGARRLAAGVAASAARAWLGTEVLFADRALGALFLLAGLAATLAGAFEGTRRLLAAEILGLAVAASALASAGESLLEGRAFFAMLVVGLLFCGPLVAAAVALPDAVERVLEPAGR
jgi:hypothetical protein